MRTQSLIKMTVSLWALKRSVLTKIVPKNFVDSILFICILFALIFKVGYFAF